MILSILGGILISFIGIFALKLFVSYKALDFYKKQGIETTFYPLLGFYKMLFLPAGINDQLFKIKELVTTKLHKPMVVFNWSDFGGSFVFLLDTDLIQEYFVKEFKYMSKLPLNQHNIGNSFFVSDSKHALKRRATFSKFFAQENLQHMIPDIHKIIYRHITGIKQKLWKDNEDQKEFKRLNLHKVLEPMFTEIVEVFLLGGSDEKLEIEGHNLTEYLMMTKTSLNKARFSLLNFLTGGYVARQAWFPRNWEGIKMKKKVQDLAMELYRNREKTGPAKGLNIIDLMIEENKSLPEDEKWSDDEIVGSVAFFQVAGADTTQFTIANLVHYIADNQKAQADLREATKYIRGPDVKAEDFEKGELISSAVQEIMRLCGSAPIAFPKVVKKSFKMGKYYFRKGDMIHMPLTLKARDERFFEDPMTFKVRRFLEKNEKARPVDNIPFSTGHRNCIGQYLAQIFLKSTLSTLYSNFEIREDPDLVPEYSFGTVYGIRKCSILIRPLTK